MNDKEFPEDMKPIGNAEFQFDCHPGLDCFTFCCKNVDLSLYPYDIIRLKNCLHLDSEEFLRRHVFLEKGGNPFFPTVKLKLNAENEKACPFLQSDGCSVYNDRPSACRTYPLERAVDRKSDQGVHNDYYFMTQHTYCRGHEEPCRHTVKSWIRSQKISEYNVLSDFWSEIDTLFATNPWKGEGAAGEKQQLSFLVCYNIDGFRRFALKNQLLKNYLIDKSLRRRIEKDDSELLKFGFEWLKSILGGKSSLVRK